MESIEKSIREFLNKYCSNGAPLYAGISGGADSMALLTALHKIGAKVTALHVNFHLRGDESNQDQLFVENFCKEHGIECRVYECDTTTYAKENGISIEMAARDLRYKWFTEQCGTDGYILIAHNANDVAETTLLNQVRGTGILGLCGIREQNGNILRPLLKHKHEDLIEYLSQNRIPHREDSTNSENIAKRNTIRNSVMPILKELNPSVIETLYANSKRMQGIEAIYRATIENLINQTLSHPISALNQQIKEIKIDCNTLHQCASPATLAHEILYPLGFNEEQIDNFIELSKKPNPGKQLISKNYMVLFERNGIYIAKREVINSEIITLNSIDDSACSVTTETGTLAFQIVTIESNNLNIIKDKNIAYFDFDKIKFPLTIRHIKDGDKIKPFGMKGASKLVSDLLNDAKVNSYERKKIPLLCDSNGIMWVVQQRACEDLKVTPQTQRVLVVKISHP